MPSQQSNIIHSKTYLCPSCQGQESDNCHQCQGRGKIYQKQYYRLCYHCDGAGYVFGRPCTICNSTGELRV